MLKSVATLWFCLHPAVLYAASLSVEPPIIDVTTLPSGESVQCIDLSIAAVEFDLAAFEFKVQYPPYITSFSESGDDWVMGNGASIRAGEMFDSRQTQSLPALMDGTLTAPTFFENIEGPRPYGVVVINRSDVPQGSAADPHPGGHVARICFNVQNTPLCASKSESVNLSFNLTDALFSDPLGTGIILPSPSLILQNDSANFVKADFNKDEVRGVQDALGAALCAINGQASCVGWEAETVVDFVQTFDFNCNGVVDAQDALSLSKWALGLIGNAAKTTGHTPVTRDVSAFYNLVELWGTSNLIADLDGDGVITVLDLVMAVELPVELQFFDIQ